MNQKPQKTLTQHIYHFERQASKLEKAGVPHEALRALINKLKEFRDAGFTYLNDALDDADKRNLS